MVVLEVGTWKGSASEGHKTLTMAKKIECRLIIHGRTRELDMGIFESKAALKKYVSECRIDLPYTIRPIK